MTKPNDLRLSRQIDNPAPIRWPVEIPARVYEHSSCPLPVTIVDISLTGCRIFAGFRLTPGRAATTFIENFAPFRGQVIWAENWSAGIRFDQHIHPSILGHIFNRYRST